MVFLASLTGLPPTAGFMGKLKLFEASLDSGLAWLAVVAALNSVVALFYYFKLARALFLRGDVGPAIEHFEESLRLDPGHEKARRNLEAARRRR